MNSFEMWITREGDDFSEDYKVQINWTHDAYGVAVEMGDEAEAKLFGPLTPDEKQRAIDMVLNGEAD